MSYRFCPIRHRVETLPSTVSELSGTARAVDITMRTATGTVQHSNATLPFREVNVSTDSAYLSAQITDQSGGDIKCEILDSDGAVIASNTSTGFPSIVTCQG